MEIGISLTLGFILFIASFHAGFNELLFVSIAVAPVAAFLNFDRGGLLTSHCMKPISVEPDWSPRRSTMPRGKMKMRPSARLASSLR
jgi:hypothetical protein